MSLRGLTAERVSLVRCPVLVVKGMKSRRLCVNAPRQVIDEDTLRNRRPESMSVSVHGVQALFVKPAHSLAPIFGMALLPAGALKTDLADMAPRQVRNFCVCVFRRASAE